jgi:hypothetical protein
MMKIIARRREEGRNMMRGGKVRGQDRTGQEMSGMRNVG